MSRQLPASPDNTPAGDQGGDSTKQQEPPAPASTSAPVQAQSQAKPGKPQRPSGRSGGWQTGRPSPGGPGSGAAQGPSGPAPNTMRKAIYLSALIYIEGDQPAPQDFTALTTSALRQTLTEAFKNQQNGLSMTVKKIDVQNNVDEEDDSASSSSSKFQF